MLEITPTPTPLKTRAELRLEERALMAIAEYNLVKGGVVDYERLGYGTDVYKLLEYLTIDAAMANAIDERGER